MRLLHTTSLELTSFLGKEKPPYAILSHTWGTDEVLFDDVRHGAEELQKCQKAGLPKVLTAALKAREENLDYIWIDTCCIDKSSSAELSEAINSMFAWYADAFVCYAFLSDYTHGKSRNPRRFQIPPDMSEWEDPEDSRWFERGWTLQELIAPVDVYFFDSTWTWFGNRMSLSAALFNVTGIDRSVLERKREATLCRGDCHAANMKRQLETCLACQALPANNRRKINRLLGKLGVSTRMSWAARRKTTRVEDIAYCLLGLFNVNMPLLYGEGTARAFQRLQLEIAHHSSDQTLLVWEGPVDRDSHSASFPGLATDPASFRDGHLFRPAQDEAASMAISSKGIELGVYLVACTGTYEEVHPNRPLFWKETAIQAKMWLAVLACFEAEEDFSRPALLLESTSQSSKSFTRFSWKTKYTEERKYIAIVKAGAKSYTRLVDTEPASNYFHFKSRQPDSGTHDPTYNRWVDESGSKFTVEFDPEAFQKTTILLHEVDSLNLPTMRTEQPRVLIKYSGLATMHHWKRMPTISTDGSTPMASLRSDVPYAYPLSWSQIKEAGSRSMAYGAVILFGNPSDDCLVLVWGLKFPKEVANRLAFVDPDGWRSKQAAPFCKICTIDPEHPDNGELLREGFSENPRDQFNEMQNLLVRVSFASATDSEPVSARDSRESNGGLMRTEAEIKVEEFLGRARFLISVSMKLEDGRGLKWLAAQGTGKKEGEGELPGIKRARDV